MLSKNGDNRERGLAMNEKREGACFFGGCVGLMLFVVFAMAGCGGGSSSGATDATDTTASGGYSLTAAVAVPTSANISALKGVSVRAGKAVTEAVAVGVPVHAEDKAGTSIGTGCTTGADGKCSITGLTSAQLTDGVVVVKDGDVPMHCFNEFSSEDIAAADAGTPPVMNCNTEEDLAYAMTVQQCGGSLGSCPETVDKKCIREALTSIVGDGTPSADDMLGYGDAIVQAFATAHINAQPGQNPAGLFINAMGGASTDFVGIAGSAVSDVPVVDAVTNVKTLGDTIKESYCEKADAAAQSTWTEVKAAAVSGSEMFDPKAIVGPIARFTRSEIGQYKPEDFRAFAGAVPLLDGGFQMFGGSNDSARLVVRNMFRQGGFVDHAQAPVVMGVMGAAFPPPARSGDWSTIDWTGYDPAVGALAADNTRLAYVAGAAAGSYKDPNTMFGAFYDALSDATRRQSFANGGAGDFVNQFVADPNNFRPAEHFGKILGGPGTPCERSDECLPCDTCSNNVCTQNSGKMGRTCMSNSDCDSFTKCAIGFDVSLGGQCMCASVIPEGKPVMETVGGTAALYGTTGGYMRPPPGTEGGPCGPQAPCGAGLTCSDSTYGGMCYPATFKKGPFAPCSLGTECMSGTCSSGACAPDANTVGSRTIGQACMGPVDCASTFCSAGLCAEPPRAFMDAYNQFANTLYPDGHSCTSNDVCGSHFCMNGFCAPLMGMQPTNMPMGSPCMSPSECASGRCNFSGGYSGVCN